MKPGGRLSRIASAFRIRRFLPACLLAWLWLVAAFAFDMAGELFSAPWAFAIVAAVCLAYLMVFGIPAYCLLMLSGRRTMPWYCLAGLICALPPVAFIWYERLHFGWAILYAMLGLGSGLTIYFAAEPRRGRVPEMDDARRPGTGREARGWRAASLLWLAAPISGVAVAWAILAHFPGLQGEQWVTCEAQFDVSQVREAERVVEEVAGRWDGLIVEVHDFSDSRVSPTKSEDIFSVKVYYDRGFSRRNDMLLRASNRPERIVLLVDYRFYPASVDGVPDVDVPRLAWEVMQALEQRLGLSFRHDSGPRSAKAEDRWRYCSTHSPGPPLP